MKKTAFVFLLAIASSLMTAAQNRPLVYNSILWKITGKNLTKPSYLFGTMHLTDKRIFNFSDSLYHFIETTEGYAAELNMQELMPQIIDQKVNDPKRERLITEMVKPGELDAYKKKLEDSLGIPFMKIRLEDLTLANSKFKNQFIKNGEMNTIIDLYLFDIAKRQGKWVGGIEDLDDQLKPIQEEDEDVVSLVKSVLADKRKVQNSLEWMIKTYLRQDLNAIDVTNGIWKGAEENILWKRNRKMAKRIDSIMNLRSCFFAVGAAHLPGDSGLVELLRRNGFTVTPVHSKNSIEPSKYSFVEKEIAWVPASVDDDWYQLLMPGKSDRLALQSGEDYNMQMYFDLSNMKLYLTLGAAIPKNKNANNDSIYIAIAKNYNKTGKIISEKNIEVNGITGKQFILKTDFMDLRLQVLISHGGLVINALGTYKTDSLFSKSADFYFNSFKVLKSAPGTSGIKWKAVAFPNHGITLKFPASYTEKTDKESLKDSVWNSHLYIANKYNDSIDMSCGLKVMEAREGYYSDQDSSYFEAVKQNLIATANVKIAGQKFELFEGFPSLQFNGTMEVQHSPLEMMVKMINRGNRRYYLYAIFVKSTASINAANAFFSSIKFNALPTQHWQYQEAPAKDISIWSPAPVKFEKGADTLNLNSDLLLFDSLAPATIIINKTNISPYAWWESDSSFFEQQKNRFIIGNYDSVLHYRLFTREGIKGADFEIFSRSNQNIKKVEILLNGDSIYSIYGILPQYLLETADYSRLYNEIIINRKRPVDYHLLHKTENIVNALSSGDSTSFAAASRALNNNSFTPIDLPILQQALMEPYRDFDIFENGTHDALMDKVLALDSGSTFPFIQQHYSLLKGNAQQLQYSFLSMLLGLKTDESFNYFIELLQQKIPTSGNSLMLSNPLKDSLQLTKSIFPKLVQLSADSNIAKLVPLIFNDLLDSGLVALNTILPYREGYENGIEHFLKTWDENRPGYQSFCKQYIVFLSHFEDKQSLRLLKQFSLQADLYIKMEAILALLHLNAPFDLRQMELVAADDYYRVSLFNRLKGLNKLKYFPAKYNSQQLIAKSELMQYFSDDIEPDEIKFISEKTAMFQGKLQRFLLYKITYTDKDDSIQQRLGVTGPYPLHSDKIITETKVMGLYNDEKLNATNTNKLINAYLKSWELYLSNPPKDN